MIKDIFYHIQKILFILFISTFSLSSLAGGVCHGKFANPLTDVCWSCLFPISIGSISVFGEGQPDTTNPSSPICICPMVPTGVRIGISLGYWEPVALVDVTRTPYCMVNLGGLQLATGAYGASGGVATQDPAHGGSFYYVHWYKFPLLYWLNLLTDALCIETGDFDVAYLTELDPTWKDDELTFLLNPEALLFGNLIAQAACSADSISTLAGLPIDSLF
jgi:conjugal transfer pilus assembly protein TraU